MHFNLNDIKIAGFSASSAIPGEKVLVQIKGIETSETTNFFVYIEQISNIIFPKASITNSLNEINQFLVVIHPDSSADFYIHDFEVQAKVKPNRTIKAGEAIYSKDIDDITEVSFPNIKINPNDQVIYLKRVRWRFGLYFDFSRKLNIENLGNEIAELHKQLIFEDILKKFLNELKLKEEQAVNDKKYSYDAFIIPEGKTDILHLKKAFSKNGYLKHVIYPETIEDLGDTGLIQFCKRANYFPPNKFPVICIFDNDNPAILKKLKRESTDSKSNNAFRCWGNNVYSFIIPIPSDRNGYKNISIEMYYSDDIISRKTIDGKRLYFDNEIKKEILPGNKLIFTPIPADKATEYSKKIYDTNANEITNQKGEKLGISKSILANMIFNEEKPFNNINFKNFYLISDIIDKIIEDSILKSKKVNE